MRFPVSKFPGQLVHSLPTKPLCYQWGWRLLYLVASVWMSWLVFRLGVIVSDVVVLSMIGILTAKTEGLTNKQGRITLRMLISLRFYSSPRCKAFFIGYFAIIIKLADKKFLSRWDMISQYHDTVVLKYCLFEAQTLFQLGFSCYATDIYVALHGCSYKGSDKSGTGDPAPTRLFDLL